MRVGNAALPLMNLVRMKGVPILNQLHLEEKLLRGTSENWCIINDGTNEPTVVMGISGSVFLSCLFFVVFTYPLIDCILQAVHYHLCFSFSSHIFFLSHAN